VTTERDDLDAEIKALRMVIAMLIESNQPDGAACLWLPTLPLSLHTTLVLDHPEAASL